jgi:hypothetical protein
VPSKADARLAQTFGIVIMNEAVVAAASAGEGNFEVDEPQFWGLVPRAHDTAGNDRDRKCEVLKAEIGRLSTNDANDFAILFDTMMDRAYSHKLWGAAYVIHGGCSDDTFNDFRSSLISRGRSRFERAIADPDSLADERFDETAWFYEGYQYAVTAGVKAVAGMRPRRRHPQPDRPSGDAWVDDDLPDLFPRLYANSRNSGGSAEGQGPARRCNVFGLPDARRIALRPQVGSGSSATSLRRLRSRPVYLR